MRPETAANRAADHIPAFPAAAPYLPAAVTADNGGPAQAYAYYQCSFSPKADIFRSLNIPNSSI